MPLVNQSVKTDAGLIASSRFTAATLPLFAGTMFLSALLMFSVQPMFTKMVLPHLGGSPSVWAVAMCFFQAVLLAGYAYAHLVIRYLSSPRGVIVHLVVMMLALVSLPIGLAAGWGRPPADGSPIWLLGLFAASVGLPFFAISGNAPLLQAWFAKTGHKHASDPYFLYGASNIGSLLALLSYPVLIEPLLALGEQSANWSLGYAVLTAVIGVSGFLMLLQRRPASAGAATPETAGHQMPAINWRVRLSWIGLAFVPSGLLVAVTTHISTDVAAAPFLWVIPLSLFLLTFIIAFQHRPIIPHHWMLAAQPVLVAVLLVATPFDLLSGHLLLSLGLNLVAFFILAMVCHGELIRKRPPAEHLTEFYLWMSFGGMLGGLFTGLIAPAVFSSVIEYPLLILVSLAARPGLLRLSSGKWRFELLLAAGLLLAVLIPKFVFGYEIAGEAPFALMIGFCLFGGLIALSRENPARLALTAVVLLLATQIIPPKSADFESIRGFFGVNKVMSTVDGQYRLLIHGTTIHGAQKIDSAGRPLGLRPQPLTYYHEGGAFADVIRAVRAKRPFRHVAAVGLGTGSLACYRREGEKWAFFEIDPIVARVARDPSRFTFLSNCAPKAPVILGDARLTLADQQGAVYDMMFLDAFSSDAIPVHLLTIEAIQSYLGKLSDDGVMLFHISNRHMNLAPVLAAAARDLGLQGLVHYPKAAKNLKDNYRSDSHVVVMARSKAHLGSLASQTGWTTLPAAASRAWTDDFSNVLGVILAASDHKLNH